MWYREKHRKKYSSRPERFRPDRKVLAGSLMALALGMMFLCVRPQNQMFEITMLDVGQGDGIFLKSFVSGNLQDSSVSEIERVSED